MKIRKGMTLVELMVSMSVFSVVLLVAVGAFINMNNMRALALSARESQQKLRMGMELISRYSRQAEEVVVRGSCDASSKCTEVEMYFNLQTATPYGVKFAIDTANRELDYYECVPGPPNTDCTASDWGPAKNLLGGEMRVNTSSGFTKNADVALNTPTATKSVTYPPSLSIKLEGNITSGSRFYQRDFNIDTRVILENIR
jgi:prepilin-type N-terminal cleavage/methylation domain-containing protein